MILQENLKVINDVIKNVALFVRQDPFVKPDFDEYLRTVGANPKSANFQSACFNYIFERRLGENKESVIKIFVDRLPNLNDEFKKAANALSKSFSSVFKLKKVLKNGFELYNIINEKTYEVTSLVKMTAFRGLGSGQYIISRIFNYEGMHYLLEISGVLPVGRRDAALRFSIAKIIQNPELVYMDNPEKFKELEENVEEVYKKFIEYFGKDEVITTNKHADDIISMFNEYAEQGEKQPFEDKIEKLEVYRYFNVNEFNNSYDNFLEKSLDGFSSHNAVYDVGIIFDRELGLYAIPFYETFNKIFEAKDYKEIENYAQCIRYFLINDKFSANIIRRVAEKYENFMKVINEVCNTNYSLDELLKTYKSKYLSQKIFSSTTVLYKSKAFSNTLGIIEENEERPVLDADIDISKIGRNDPCPCGSGKKFKKCCGAHLMPVKRR